MTHWAEKQENIDRIMEKVLAQQRMRCPLKYRVQNMEDKVTLPWVML